MSNKKTLGGNRLGAGQKNKFTLPNFERSTHNMSKTWRSSMSVGTLVPAYCQIGLNGDTFSFDTNAMIRTLPTNAPLMGTFKFQLDFFSIPMRLYNGLTHSNAVNIGNDIDKVKFPKMQLYSTALNPDIYSGNLNTSQLSSSCLHNYLGLRGLGMYDFQDDTEKREHVSKTFQCIPHLGYYDIYKNYYANKQEKNGKIISVNATTTHNSITKVFSWFENTGQATDLLMYNMEINSTLPQGVSGTDYLFFTVVQSAPAGYQTLIPMQGSRGIQVDFTQPVDTSDIKLYTKTGTNVTQIPVNNYTISLLDIGNSIRITPIDGQETPVYGIVIPKVSVEEKGEIAIVDFPLNNIDKMKFEILKDVGLGNEFVVNTVDLEPYNTLHGKTDGGNLKCKYPMVGLALKTYQSDIFNNWMSTATINAIKQASMIPVVSGSISLESIFLANKTMKLLTAIAVSGGTYQNWQEAVYGDAPNSYEIPVYHGSMSAEIGFDEVVSTAETKNEMGAQPLGTMAGKADIINVKGGNIEIKVNEPCFIMAIASLTPRIDYCQGNKFFYLDDFSSFDDLHKPQMDGIMYQDLPTETMAWWSRMKFEAGSDNYRTFSAGKIPAWMFYMTDFDEVHGDFVTGESLDSMVLTRGYELNRDYGNSLLPRSSSPIEDLTTYIDPSKFNYAFANASLDAQNFWTQIAFDCKLRRKISAKVIPTM